MPTTIGQIIVNEALPPKYRDYNRTLGADELEALLADIIKNDPDAYRDVSAKLMRIGNKAAYEGGTTLRLSDIAPPMDNSAMYRRLDAAEDIIRNNPRLSDEAKKEALVDLYDKVYAGTKQKAYDTALTTGNGFALQVKSKARGNQDQLSAMINTPGTYQDASGRTIPFFIRHSYAQGLSPAEYFASLYGARMSIISTKFATAKAGELGKLLSSASLEQVVTEDDCGTINGMPTTPDDKDNVGAVLARKAGKYDAGTVVTKEVLADLRNDKVEDIMVRSPTTCNAKNGICAHCAGIRENGKFPEIGYNLGLNSGAALAERIAQGSLNCLVEGTLVRMADGTVRPIEKVEPGEFVFGSDKDGRVFPTRVVNRYDNGVQPCVRTKIIKKSGALLPTANVQHHEMIVLESTSVHKVLMNRRRIDEIGKIAHSALTEKGRSEIRDDLVIVVSFWKGGPATGEPPESIWGTDAEAGTSITACPIWSQEDIGLRHVYDIEVECPDHIFLLANGLIVSNTKHSGKKLKGAGKYQGFEMIKRMATIPKIYTDKATVSEIDGKVTKILPAPQGGSYVYVDDERHYVPHGYDLLVKKGDEVEAGDQLSDGVVSPYDAVRLKGIGEGRRYFTHRFTQAFRDSGYKVNRRNVEAVAKALINNVVVEDPDAEGEMLPGDNVSYASWAWAYRPRPDSIQSSPNQAIGKYLEQPVLHYTIGTRITPKVAKELDKFKVPTVLYNRNPVGVRPEMQSIVQTTGSTDDWMGRLGTTYIGKRLVEDVQRGAESNSQGINPYPAVAKGTTLGQWGSPGHKNEEFHY